jgi:hypothetical protein
LISAKSHLDFSESLHRISEYCVTWYDFEAITSNPGMIQLFERWARLCLSSSYVED